MATLLYHKGEKSLIDAWLSGRGSAADYGSPVTVPDGTSPSNFGLGLGTRVGGVGSTRADVMAQILEVGTSVAAGYGRASLARSTSGWPAATLVTGHYQTTAPQQTFTFSGAPNPNGATLWFVAGSTTTNHDNVLFGADLAATRTFAASDVEKITATVALS